MDWDGEWEEMAWGKVCCEGRGCAFCDSPEYTR